MQSSLKQRVAFPGVVSDFEQLFEDDLKETQGMPGAGWLLGLPLQILLSSSFVLSPRDSLDRI